MSSPLHLCTSSHVCSLVKRQMRTTIQKNKVLLKKSLLICQSRIKDVTRPEEATAQKETSTHKEGYCFIICFSWLNPSRAKIRRYLERAIGSNRRTTHRANLDSNSESAPSTR